MSLFLTMLACGIITFLIRFSFIGAGKWLPQSPKLQAVLRYVPPAVLAALITPDIFLYAAAPADITLNPRLWAVVAAAVVAYFSRSVVATLAVGMAALWLLEKVL